MSSNYTEDFKRKIIELRLSGRSISNLSKEYQISKSSIHAWEQQYKNSGKFGITANLSDAEKELKVLQKDNKRLRMENDILKQAALILGRKSE